MSAVGAWHADLDVDSAKAVEGRVTLAFSGGLTLVGTVSRGGVYQDRTTLRVVAGAGGLGKELPARHYRVVQAATPIRDVLTEAGETLSGAAPSVTLAHWARSRGSAGGALDALASVTGCIWYVSADGKVVIAAEAWPEVTKRDAYQVLSHAVSEGRMVLGVEAPFLTAGVTFQAQKVRYVVHTLEPSKTRTEVFFA